MGSEGLTEATSNVGPGAWAGACASSEPADNMMAALRNGNKLFDTAVYLAIAELSDILGRILMTASSLLY
jgi:hypothetical protein